MKNFRVSLTRVYHVDIEAGNEEAAKELVEYYIGDPKDSSLLAEKVDENFTIGEIEVIYNEATDVEEIKEDE